MVAPATLRRPDGGLDWLMAGLLGFLGLVVLDVIGLFAGEILHIKALMTGALAIFVWVQVGMTIACLASFPLTLLSRLSSSVRRKR